VVYLKTCSFRHLNKNISKQNFKLFLKSRYIVLERVPFEFMYEKNGGHRARSGENDLLFL